MCVYIFCGVCGGGGGRVRIVVGVMYCRVFEVRVGVGSLDVEL